MAKGWLLRRVVFIQVFFCKHITVRMETWGVWLVLDLILLLPHRIIGYFLEPKTRSTSVIW